MQTNVLTELCSIQLTLIGISFSIFTIYFSLVLGKLDVLHNISNQIKQGNKSSELKQTEHFCLKSIKRLKKMCRCSIFVCCISIFMTLLMWCFKIWSLNSIIYYSVISLNIIDFIGIFSLILVVFISYFKETKFD